MQVGTVEFAETGYAEQAEAALHLVLHQLEQADDASLAGRGQRIALHAAEPDQMRAGGNRLDDVGAAAERTVDDDFCAATRRLDDLRQHIHGAAAVIELAPAMVGHIDPVDPVLDRDPGVFCRGDALDGERNVEPALDALDRVPVERRLEFAAGGAAATQGDEALGDVALAPAVD